VLKVSSFLVLQSSESANKANSFKLHAIFGVALALNDRLHLIQIESVLERNAILLAIMGPLQFIIMLLEHFALARHS